jgi:proton glutamate symport protein
MKNGLLLAAVSVVSLAILISLLAGAGVLPLSPVIVGSVRWLAILLIAGAATSRRSLTGWILVGLLAGAETGHDWPLFAAQLQFLGAIFLRLIKVIIAPLLFGTLVVGIAGHGDLKKVGRLGIKSLIYFEIVSTIALLIGCAAINLSRAGEGIRLPASSTGQSLGAVPHTAAQIITDIFPENIAKSVAEGQVLQVVVFSILFAIALILVPEPKRRPKASPRPCSNSPASSCTPRPSAFSEPLLTPSAISDLASSSLS